MGKTSLGRVLDPSALDACDRARARLSVEVPAAWIAEGADLMVTAPPRLACARCDGGGCDACERSGALRSPVDTRDRTVRARLPSAPPASTAGEPWAIALRIPYPFGPEHAIAQLLLEVRASARPSACVSRIAHPPGPPPGVMAPLRIPLPIFAAAVIAAVLFALFGR